MSAPSAGARALAQQLHDELRADIPTFKIMGKSLLPEPWSQERIDGIAALVDQAIDGRIEAALLQAGFVAKGRRVA